MRVERFRARLAVALIAVASAISIAGTPLSAAEIPALRFAVSFPASVHAHPITGRVFVILSTSAEREPRLQAGFWGDAAPMFAADADQLSPGQETVIDANTLGYPVRSLKELPAGDYYVQALMNVYTEFHRADGHVIWAHLDQWEGQQFNRSPGNLYSEAGKIHLDPAAGYDVKLTLSKVIPPIELPADTPWVKHVKIQSKLLTQFWGRPIFLGATLLLPKGYDAHPEVQFPVIYVQDHFSLAPPFGFTTDESSGGAEGRHGGWGHAFYQAWVSDNFPRLIAVTFQHPTPYFDDSYAVNSANNGPYGDALMTELIPYLERHFRMLPKAYARLLVGGSTGGWESLALQVFHPDFFGGAWVFFPDPVDFRRYDLTNIYSDENAFYEPGHPWTHPPRYIMRNPNGQPEVTTREFSQLEAVLGSHGRSGQQLEAWEAVYGPVGDDGYPKPLWDKLTGKVNHDVGLYMRDHGYDLRDYLEQHWPRIGPSLAGKMHFYVGDMDHFYLNLAVYLMEDFLKQTRNPEADATFEYGRPMKGHGWFPMTIPELVRMMAQSAGAHAPAGENTKAWHY